MKKIVLLLTLILTCSLLQAQTIRRVNNNPGVTGTNIYSTIQAAHDAASNGDIVYVESSVTNYGGLICTKNLKIYGPGYFLDVNQDLISSRRDAGIGNVTFNLGSSASEMYGVNVSSVLIGANVNDISIRRCYVSNPGIAISNTNLMNNLVVTQCYIGGSVSIGGGGSTSLASNVLFENNIVMSSFSTTNNFVNNIIVRNNTISSMSGSNMLIENNILFTNINMTLAFTSCTLQSNVAVGTLPSGNGNQSGIVLANELVFPSFPGGVSLDRRYELKNGSPLKTAGTGGVEVGAFGGSQPYRVSGLPAIPSISNLSVSPTGTSTTPLSVTISTKSNN